MRPTCHSPTDGSDEPGDILQLLRPTPTWRPGGPGRNPLELRRVLHGIFSVNQTGCPWRMRPTDVGHGPTSYGYVRRWRREGVWDRLMTTWRHGERQGQGRRPAPSAACAESPRSTTATPGTAVGLDGNQQVKGRTRPMWVETRGRMVAVVGTAAKTEDRQGWVTLLKRYWAAGVTQLRKIWVAGGYDA